MLFANWLDVPDAMAFLDALAEAAEKTRGWKLDSINADYGHQFVYVRYTGRKFAGTGLMASALAPIDQPIRTPSASAGRSTARGRNRPSLALRIPMQRVNLTIRADERPTDVCFDQSAQQLLSPLLKANSRATQATIKPSRAG